MTPEELDLARALVALDAWEWRAGMLPLRHCGPAGRLATETEHGGRLLTVVSGQRFPADALLDYCWPDLHDPATAGVLLEMLVEAADGQYVATECTAIADVVMWTVRILGRTGDEWGCTVIEAQPTLGVAVARALLAVLS